MPVFKRVQKIVNMTANHRWWINGQMTGNNFKALWIKRYINEVHLSGCRIFVIFYILLLFYNCIVYKNISLLYNTQHQYHKVLCFTYIYIF